MAFPMKLKVFKNFFNVARGATDIQMLFTNEKIKSQLFTLALKVSLIPSEILLQ